jgi:hypothetical protein
MGLHKNSPQTSGQRVSISGFTFIRNGVELGFPFEASIR